MKRQWSISLRREAYSTPTGVQPPRMASAASRPAASPVWMQVGIRRNVADSAGWLEMARPQASTLEKLLEMSVPCGMPLRPS